MKQNLTEKPILLSVLAILAAMPMIWLFLIPIARLIHPGFRQTLLYAGTLLVAAAFCQECYGKIPFSLEKKGFLRGLFPAGLVGILCALGALGFSYQRPESFPLWQNLLGFFLGNLLIAVSEEFLFRGLILTALESKYPLKKAVLLCSLLFGLRHLLNLVFSPGTPIATLGQVGFTFFAGIYLCALCRVTGNLWVGVFIHLLENLCSGFWALFVSGPTPDGEILPVLLLVALHSIYGLAGWQLLKAHHKL